MLLGLRRGVGLSGGGCPIARQLGPGRPHDGVLTESEGDGQKCYGKRAVEQLAATPGRCCEASGGCTLPARASGAGVPMKICTLASSGSQGSWPLPPGLHVRLTIACRLANGAYDGPGRSEHAPQSRAMIGCMMTTTTRTSDFTPTEREYIRRELDMFFSMLPAVAEGFQLKTWRGGPQAGAPKLPPAASTLIERGYMRLDTNVRPSRVFFTEAGISALHRMVRTRGSRIHRSR